MWHRPVVAALLLSALVLLGALPVRSLAQATDPAHGTWELNVAKSTYSPGPAPRSQTRTYTYTGERVSYIARGTDAEGKPTLAQYNDVMYDGKDYPITGLADADTISFRRVDRSTVEYTQKRNGKVVITGRRVISPDGRVMTNTSQGTNAKGQKVSNVLVLDVLPVMQKR